MAFTVQSIEQTTQTEPLISLGAADGKYGVGKVEANHTLYMVGGDVNTDFTKPIGRVVDGWKERWGEEVGAPVNSSLSDIVGLVEGAAVTSVEGATVGLSVG